MVQTSSPSRLSADGARVSAALITGFLGSGKTTLLRHVLQHGLDGRRVAVVVNDLAPLGIDGHVVSGLQNVESMVDLDNGCICCSIDFRFEYALEEIVTTVAPDLVLIESTGVADPQILMEKIPKTRLVLDSVVTVVDAENVDRALTESIAAQAQIVAADFLVLNKVDLVDSVTLDRVADRMVALNPRAVQVRTRYGRVLPSLLFDARPARPPSQRASSGDHLSADAIESFVCAVQGGIDRPRFEAFLRALPRPVYRAKGIVQFVGEAAPSLFNYTCGRYDFHWLPTASPTAADGRAVFIGPRIGALEARIRAALAECRESVWRQVGSS